MRNVRRQYSQASVLVLNASYEPITICGVRSALKKLVKNKAVVQERAGDKMSHAGIPTPSVIRLIVMARVPRRTQVLSRKNILLRDRHTCQYCAVKLHASELTLDHVIPKSRGGRDVWENLVACCRPCNKHKDNLLLEECGMVLLSRPRPATIHTSRVILRSMGAEDEQWKKYLFYDQPESHLVTRAIQ